MSFRQLCDRFALSLLAFLAPTSASLGQDAPAQKKAGTIEIEKRTLESEKYGKIEHEIGTLYVPENRSDPGSRVISVGFARYRSLNKEKTPPIFYLMGGPGWSMVEPIEGLPTELKHHGRNTPDGILSLREFGDLVVIDQRGFTNRGDAFVELFEAPRPRLDEPYDKRLLHYREFVQRVVDKYAKTDVDLRGYTVLELADDVADLRKALGYEKIALFGGSFGSQWSLAVMRRHPKMVKRALLCAVAPLGKTVPLPTHTLNAAKRKWKAVEKDPRFTHLLPKGGMQEVAETWLKKLEENPTFTKPGDPTFVVRTLGPMDFPSPFSHNELLACYHGQTAHYSKPREPERHHEILINRLIRASNGETEERRNLIKNDPARAMVPSYFSLFAYFEAANDIWPSPDIGDAYRKPVKCEIPVLFVQGDWDDTTPIENTYELAKSFTNHFVQVVEQGDHGQTWFEAFAPFLKTGSFEGIQDRIQADVKLEPPTPSLEVLKKAG